MNYAARVRAVLDGATGADDFAVYRDDPCALAVEVLGITPWNRQADVLRAVASDARVSVRSGHKSGKSEGLAIAALWFALTRPGARVVATAPIARQVRHVFWKALKRLVSAARRPLAAQANDVPALGCQFANGSEIIGFTADNPEQFAGISGAELLFIVDEASGVEAGIFEAIEGSAAGGARVVLCGNPTRPSGVFFDSFHDRREFWRTLHISSEETPNVVEGRIVIPGLATRAWVEGRRADWGGGSALYAVRVLGEFPSQGSNNVVGLELVEAATRRWDESLFDQETGRLTIGCDPARYGDDESVVFVVRGKVAHKPLVYRSLDSIQLAGRVFEAARRYTRPHEVPIVRVDEIGIGAGVLDQLRTMPDLKVEGINASSAARGAKYARCRDELWFGVADWLKGGGAIPEDSKLVGELVAVEYAFTNLGKLKVESKDDLRARLGRSPDRADALALAVYQPATSFDGAGDHVTAGSRRGADSDEDDFDFNDDDFYEGE